MAMVDSTGGTEYSSDSFEVEEEIELSDSGSAGQLVPQSKMKTLATEQSSGPGALQLQSTEPKENDDSMNPLPLGQKIQKPSDIGRISNQTFHSMRRVSARGRELNRSTLPMKSFRDSREVRDAVFSEWLTQKNKVISREGVAKARERMQEEERKTKKEVGGSFINHWVYSTGRSNTLIRPGVVWTPDPTCEEGSGNKPCPEVS